jgi:hypothetical protein
MSVARAGLRVQRAIDLCSGSVVRNGVLLDPSPRRDESSSNRHDDEDREQTGHPIVSHGCRGLRDRLEGHVKRRFRRWPGPIASRAVQGAGPGLGGCPIAR